jgi:hypothetical protein
VRKPSPQNDQHTVVKTNNKLTLLFRSHTTGLLRQPIQEQTRKKKIRFKIVPIKRNLARTESPNPTRTRRRIDHGKLEWSICFIAPLSSVSRSTQQLTPRRREAPFAAQQFSSKPPWYCCATEGDRLLLLRSFCGTDVWIRRAVYVLYRYVVVRDRIWLFLAYVTTGANLHH